MSVKTETVRYDHPRTTVSFNGLPQEIQSSLAVSPLGGEYLKNLALVVNGSPQIVGFAIDPNE